MTVQKWDSLVLVRTQTFDRVNWCACLLPDSATCALCSLSSLGCARARRIRSTTTDGWSHSSTIGSLHSSTSCLSATLIRRRGDWLSNLLFGVAENLNFENDDDST